jgi:hypothetical protein
MLVPAPIRQIAPGITEQTIDARHLFSRDACRDVRFAIGPLPATPGPLPGRARFRIARFFRRYHRRKERWIPEGYAWVRGPLDD